LLTDPDSVIELPLQIKPLLVAETLSEAGALLTLIVITVLETAVVVPQGLLAVHVSVMAPPSSREGV
jgi:hypothetical protein